MHRQCPVDEESHRLGASDLGPVRLAHIWCWQPAQLDDVLASDVEGAACRHENPQRRAPVEQRQRLGDGRQEMVDVVEHHHRIRPPGQHGDDPVKRRNRRVGTEPERLGDKPEQLRRLGGGAETDHNRRGESAQLADNLEGDTGLADAARPRQ